MALIICPECKSEISDKAVMCPRCGAPIGNMQEKAHIITWGKAIIEFLIKELKRVSHRIAWDKAGIEHSIKKLKMIMPFGLLMILLMVLSTFLTILMFNLSMGWASIIPLVIVSVAVILIAWYAER